MARDTNKYPAGLSRKKVQSVIDTYSRQSTDDAIAEADAAWENSRMALVRVPLELVREVERLVATRSAQSQRRKIA